MRMLKGAAALAVGLALASHASAGDPSNVKSRASVGNGFDFNISRLFSLGRTSTTTPANAAIPIARPQQGAPKNTALSNFLPKVQLPAAGSKIGLSHYPTKDQMPGAAYLKAFGLQRAPRVSID